MASNGRGLDGRGGAKASFARVAGVRPVRGRWFTAEEADPARQARVVLLSWEICQRELGGTEGILGKTLPIQRDLYTVIGILPRGFTGFDLAPVDLWLPMGALTPGLATTRWWQERGTFCLQVVARLRPGVTSELAGGLATQVDRRSHQALNDRDAARRGVSFRPIQAGYDPEEGRATGTAVWLSATSTAVLLIACFNVAGLLLVRSFERRRELAVRLALGARRFALGWLLLGESLLLALAGGILAYGVAGLCGRLFRAFLLPETIAPAGAFDWRLLLLLALLSLAAALLSGLAPALGIPVQTAQIGELIRPGAAAHPGSSRLRASFLVAQVALTCVLLVFTGLMLRSLQQARSIHLGFDSRHVLAVTPDLASLGATPAAVDASLAMALERLRHSPGIESASLSATIPLLTSAGSALSLPGRGFVMGLAPGGVALNPVSDGFLATLGIPLFRGRSLAATDTAGSERVAVIGFTMAHLLWPGEDPLGRCLKLAGDSSPCTTVVGVAGDSHRFALDEPASFQIYVPLSQAPPWISSRALLVRSRQALGPAAGAIRTELLRLFPRLPFIEVRPLAELVDQRVLPWRRAAALFSLFGGLALLLAASGIVAAVAQAVSFRTHELAVRIALGARWPNLLWLVMRSGFLLALAGVALGLALGLFGTRSIQPLLFRITATDPAALLAAPATLLAAALLASYLAGRRARRTDPAAAMRRE